MATILLSAAGAAVGAGLGGTVLGLSGAVIGRSVGAALGRAIDQRIMGAGSQAVDVGRTDRFRLMGASEGAAIPLVWGRTRVAGQVIWATQFQETVTARGGKGAPKPKVREYSYTVSLAVALCEGEITRVGRIWADGLEIEKDQLSLRVYTGSETQMPDPKIAAVEGVDQAPAYRGTAYVVIEDLDLSQFGNRVPQFNFEVMRRAKREGAIAEDLASSIRGVAVIPGTGEYSLATTRVHYAEAIGVNRSANVNSVSSKTDFEVSLEQLAEELPEANAVSLVVSWFGDDLRCGNCLIKPKVEQTEFDGVGMPWRAGGIGRIQAETVISSSGRPLYGGTPADGAVIEAIQAANQAGKQVMFYPFILMEQLAGNTLPNPWTGLPGQPALPWRGRITTSLAPGLPGTTDRTSSAIAEVASFFGNAQVSDFTVASGEIHYSGPSEWRYRRFILHYARLCALAGGVESFCIGSEMVGASTIRDQSHGFPFVNALKSLAADVRSILGPQVKISYAADWSEYFGVHRDGNVYFHLDPLWSDANVDFIGIDNYMPLTDWRDGSQNADGAFGSIYDLSYLKAGIAGGEGFDWYYNSESGRNSQNRLPITDGSHDEAWVFRYKDLKNWWLNQHFNRISGVRQPAPTDWVPTSKPFRFTEYGCAAVDKGTNQPNKFVDPKSTESGLPFFSTGARDDFIQHQYYVAQRQYWLNSTNNPISRIYGSAMLDFDHCFAWAWDARPYPHFPLNLTLWNDGANYTLGHWINGRVSGQALSAVVDEVCERSDLHDVITSNLSRVVRGYSVTDVQTAREILQPLSLAYSFDAIEGGGELGFEHRGGNARADLTEYDFAIGEDSFGSPEITRSNEAESAGHVQFGFIEDNGAYQTRYCDALFPDRTSIAVAQIESTIVFRFDEARAIAERWLTEARTARESIEVSLPPSGLLLNAGDTIQFKQSSYRIDRVERQDTMRINAVRSLRSVYQSLQSNTDNSLFVRPVAPPLPVFAAALDLPLLQASDTPYAPYLAIAARPWQGDVAVWRSLDDNDYTTDLVVSASAAIGQTLSVLPSHPLGIWDDGDALHVRMVTGSGLQSVSEAQLFAGANAIAIGGASSLDWEILQFQTATLIGPQTYALGRRLRGQLGTDCKMPDFWPTGSKVIVLNNQIRQLQMPSVLRDVELKLRVGAFFRGPDDASAVSVQLTPSGVGLRPYSVAHLRGQVLPNGDLSFQWIRRTRQEGDSWQAYEVPLAEEIEQYQVEVRQGSSVIRQVFTSVANWTYPQALQLADNVFGPVDISVAQVSQSYGAGPARSVQMTV